MGTIADKLAKLEETKEAIKTAINDPSTGDKFSNYPIAIMEGKAYIAQKVTEKGVPTEATATFQQIGDNVGLIKGTGEIVRTRDKEEIASLYYDFSDGKYKAVFIRILYYDDNEMFNATFISDFPTAVVYDPARSSNDYFNDEFPEGVKFAYETDANPLVDRFELSVNTPDGFVMGYYFFGGEIIQDDFQGSVSMEVTFIP